MALLERIETDLLQAIKSQQELPRDVLRGLKSAIKNQQIEQGSELDDAAIEGVVARELKRRKESIEAYNQAGKPDLAKIEQSELEILQAYMPEQLGEAEIAEIIDKAIAELGEAANTGSVMGKLSGQLRGRADMKEVSRIVAQKLSGN